MAHENTVLIVDDEITARKTLRALLLGQPYNLAFAANGKDALAQAAELDPDLILLDVMMPEMDGFEVCRRLRANPFLAEVPIIMVTALDDRESRLKAIEAGADDFVSKPFDRVELRARVRATIRLNRYRRLLLERTYRQEAEQEIERRNYELTILNHVLTIVASTLSINDILYVACEALVQVFELPRANAVLLDEEQTQFTTLVEYEAPGIQLVNQDYSLVGEIPIVGRLSTADLLDFNTPLALVEGNIEPNLTRVQHLMQELDLGSLLIVPILIHGQVAGFIELMSTEQHHLNKRNLDLAQSITAVIGQTVEKINSYHDLQLQVHGLEEVLV
ncbi:MAG: response regulator [Anaerolineae bacterium]|nr:response regulator [Anaerolineae bacterium]